LDKLKITEVKAPALGATQPSIVEAKVTIDLSNIPAEF